MKKNLSIYNRIKSKLSNAIDCVGAASLLMLVSMQSAHADDAVSKLLNKAVDLLTNKWAYGSAILAVAYMGYQIKWGEMNKRRAIGTIIGIVIVFGAASIVDQFK